MSLTKTRVMVLKIRRHWQGMRLTTDRRRHRRFDTTALTAQVGMIASGEKGLQLHPCSLRDVSYGGMSFTTDRPLDAEAEYRFVLELGSPFEDMVLVRARVVWVDAQDTGRLRVGARFTQSSKGWLGPDEEGSE